MKMNVTNNKDEGLIRKNIKIVLGISLFVIVVLVMALMNIKNMNIKNVIEYNNITSVNYVLAFISVCTCGIYYYIYKTEEFFLITLVYISLAVGYLCETIVISKIYGIDKVLGLLMLNSIARLMLVELIIRGKNRVTVIINKQKELSIIITIALTVSLSLLEIYFKYINFEVVNVNTVVLINIGILILYARILFRLAIKIIKECEFIWAIIVASTNMFILKKIYLIINVYFGNDNLYEVCKIFVLFGFSILIAGLFTEIINKVKENDNLKEELEVFYTLTEQNPTNNIIVCNEENEVIYANSLMRSHKEIYSDDIRKTYENIYKLKKQINSEFSKATKKIEKELKKNGYFKDALILEDGIIIKLDVREVKINDNKIRTVVSFRDISDDYNSQRQLKINESKFITMTESIKDIIATIDVYGTITYVNSMAEKIVGYTKEELVGKKYTMLLDEAEERTYNFIKSNYKDSAFMGHKVICKDNSVIVMESVVSKIFTENNELVGHAIVSRDIGYRHEFESLKIKYDEIKQYDKIRNEFFANLSHEVRTPINIIYSCFQLLNNQKVNGPEALALYYDKYEKTIKQNCFRMLRLVNNLIDITKIDSGFVKMRFGNYDIINLVEDITLSVVPYVEVKKINIMFDTEVEELEIKCDPDEIERVMLNLLSNAIKFNNVGGNILVNIVVNENWVEIRVKDTGIGIAKELRQLVFERFMQTDKSLNREKEGSGIGLALVKSLVELHNGEVYINEEIEIGSEFIVRLPNVLCEVESDEVKNISGNNSKPTEEKISIELSDIYDLA